MHWEQRGQLRHPDRWLAIDFLFEPPRSIRYPESPSDPVDLGLAEDGETVRAMPDESPHLPGTKRSTSPEDEDTFEQARLPSAVRAKDVIATRMELEVGLAQTPQGRDPDAAQRQDQRLRAPNGAS